MYFIQHGVVKIRSNECDEIKYLSDGSYFGEVSILTGEKRNASIWAVTNCNIYSLHCDDLNEVLDRNPVMRTIMEKVAVARVSSWQDSETAAEQAMKKYNSIKEKRSVRLKKTYSERWDNGINPGNNTSHLQKGFS